MLTAADVHQLNAADLRALLAAGHPIDPATLDGAEYDGTSLNLPTWVERLTWKKFRKVFRRDAAGTLRGWNVRLRDMHVFGHFEVVPARGRRTPFPVEQALLLDYGRGANGVSPLHFVRDPLVAVNAGSSQLLLGGSYVEVFGGAPPIATPSYFTLDLRS